MDEWIDCRLPPRELARALLGLALRFFAYIFAPVCAFAFIQSFGPARADHCCCCGSASVCERLSALLLARVGVSVHVCLSARRRSRRLNTSFSSLSLTQLRTLSATVPSFVSFSPTPSHVLPLIPCHACHAVICSRAPRPSNKCVHRLCLRMWSAS